MEAVKHIPNLLKNALSAGTEGSPCIMVFFAYFWSDELDNCHTMHLRRCYIKCSAVALLKASSTSAQEVEFVIWLKALNFTVLKHHSEFISWQL